MGGVHRGDVDGVPAFWVETGRPTLSASLLFRQGMADEEFTTSGWTHLVEHSALHGRGGGALAVNGSVSVLTTSFDTHGPAEAVAAHLSDLSRWLTEPTFDDLAREAGVLRAEADRRGGAGVNAFVWRYGARGPGLVSANEPGLGNVTVADLVALTRRVFTRGNAVLVLDGPPPATLRLTLPDGARRDPRPAVPCDDRLPAAYVERAGLVLSGVVRRSIAATLLPALLERGLREKFRDEAGAAYAPWSTYEAVDGEQGLVLAGTDLDKRALEGAVPSILRLSYLLSTDGPPPDHLRDQVEGIIQAMRDPYQQAGLAWRAGNDHLWGREIRTLDELITEVEDVRAEHVTASAHELHSSLLLGVPSETPWHDELPMLSAPTQPTRKGRRFRSRNWPASEARLVVGDGFVQVAEGDTARVIDVPEIVGMVAFSDDARLVMSADGWSINVEPTMWRRGDRAIAALDQLIPAALHVPHPDTPGATSQPMSAARRWWLGIRRLAAGRAGAFALMVILVAVAVAALATGHYGGIIPILLGFWMGLRGKRSDKGADRFGEGAWPDTPHR